MKKMWNKDRLKNILMTISAIVMLFIIYVYLLHADLSTAPEYVYNQF